MNIFCLSINFNGSSLGKENQRKSSGSCFVLQNCSAIFYIQLVLAGDVYYDHSLCLSMYAIGAAKKRNKSKSGKTGFAHVIRRSYKIN